MFQLTNAAICPAQLRERFQDPQAGAMVIFEGRVRNHNAGQAVRSLEYQAYPGMAQKEGQKILHAAKTKFALLDAFCVHAEGHLNIGDIAIWIITTAVHRRDAYLASEYIIDTVKKTVPIWKREHYLLGDPSWVACHHCQGPDHAKTF